MNYINFDAILSPKKSFIFTLACVVLYFAWFVALDSDFESIPELISFPACLFFSVYAAAFLFHIVDFLFQSIKKFLTNYLQNKSASEKNDRIEKNARNVLGHLSEEERMVLVEIFMSEDKELRLSHFDHKVRDLCDLGFILEVERISGSDTLFVINSDRDEMIGEIAYPKYYKYVKPRFDLEDTYHERFLSLFSASAAYEVLELEDEDNNVARAIHNAKYNGFISVEENMKENCYNIKLSNHFVNFLLECSTYKPSLNEIKLRLI
ncbi:MAG: hypothetical protein ACQERP_09725 [Pseudomonadota bacterium]